MKDFPAHPSNKRNIQPTLGEEFDILHTVNPHTLREMHPTYQKAHKKAIDIVMGKRIHLDPSDFDYKDLEQDKASVIRKIEQINSSPKKEGEMEAVVQAEILEAMLFDLIKNHDFLGKNISSVLPSSYDDLFLGNDIILCESFGPAKSYTGLGIDVTIGEISLMNKFQATKRRLEEGKLGMVKYFKSEDGDYTGKLNNIPHFVVGMSRENLFRITQMWLDDNIKEIKKQSIAEGLIMMMICQCDEFMKIPKENVQRVYREEKERLSIILENLKKENR